MATRLEEAAFKRSQCYARNLSAAPSAWPHWRHYVSAHIVLMHSIYLAVRQARTRWHFHFGWVRPGSNCYLSTQASNKCRWKPLFFCQIYRLFSLISVFISDQGRKLILKVNNQDRNINDTYADTYTDVHICMHKWYQENVQKKVHYCSVQCNNVLPFQ